MLIIRPQPTSVAYATRPMVTGNAGNGVNQWHTVSVAWLMPSQLIAWKTWRVSNNKGYVARGQRTSLGVTRGIVLLMGRVVSVRRWGWLGRRMALPSARCNRKVDTQ